MLQYSFTVLKVFLLNILYLKMKILIFGNFKIPT